MSRTCRRTGFKCTMTKVGKSDWERTFAGTHGNDEDAPIAAVRSAALDPRC